MHTPSICLTKWLRTLWACVGLHSTMGEHVRFRCPAWPNDLLHWTQGYALFLLWVIGCELKCAAWLNAFLHSEQAWALTRPWVSMCCFRLKAWPNEFPNSAHLCTSSSVCILSPLLFRFCLVLTWNTRYCDSNLLIDYMHFSFLKVHTELSFKNGPLLPTRVSVHISLVWNTLVSHLSPETLRH